MPALPFQLDPQVGASVIALFMFIALAVGEVPGLKLNRATIAMVGSGAVLILGVITLRKSLIIIALMVVAFLAGVNVTQAAFIAACAILISRRFESGRILGLVDWPLLVMFGGLFIVTGALEITGVSERLFEWVKPLAFSGTAALAFVTTILSNLISNVPAVLLFRPLVPEFADPTKAWLTLAAASTLAGNLTLIGSVANLIVAEQAKNSTSSSASGNTPAPARSSLC
jgi:Na+/H+ antiporter NhaD/arsenite permease-like protein